MTPFDIPFAFIDLETTGATSTIDRVTEIAIISFDGISAQRWSQLVNPQMQISPFIEGLTGISNQMVSTAPLFAEIADEVLQRLQGHLFVAHNARFDYGFLKSEFKRLEMTFRAKVVCTVKLSRKLYPEHAKHNLDSLIERHGIVIPERHRAMADADALLQFWQSINAQLAPELILAAIKEQTARPTLPPHLDPDIVDQLPKGHGVYLFFGENKLPIYIGKSNALRQRVLSHFSADHAIAKEMTISLQVRHIEWIECAGEIDALITEARLIKERSPTLNRQLRRNSSFCSWQLVTHTNGYLRPQLVYAKDLDLGRQDHIYGTFKSANSARELLLQALNDHHLCNAILGLEKVAEGKPCFAYQLKQCRGACVGEESSIAHNARLLKALTRMRLRAWPFSGAAALREGEVHHVIDAWCYLGSAKNAEEIAQLLQNGTPQFDRDTYRILVKYLDRMTPITAEKI